MQAEGIAMPPGPRMRLDPALLTTLRHAILGVQLVEIRYAVQGAADLRICPASARDMSVSAKEFS